MKKLKTACVVLLIAAMAIGLWESAHQLFSPARWHEQYLHDCIETYAEYKEALNASLPRLLDSETAPDTRQMILDPLIAYVQDASPGDRVIVIPLADIGDFYQRTYTYGLIWAADYNRLLEKNPDLILVSLENGWCAYASTSPQ